MRVYELAKQCGCTSKELIDFLKNNGFAVHSHMSVVEDKGIELVLKKYTSPDSLKVQQSEVLDSGGENESKDMEKMIETPKMPLANPVVADALKEETPVVKKAAMKSVTKAPIMLGELAEKIGVPATELIIYLLKKGLAFSKNQKIPENILEDLARAFEFELKAPVASAARVITETAVKNLTFRAPVVVVIGHVDHGKTTLLDYIRKTRVADKEKGGITQHLGAYEVKTKHGGLIFLDTPGHEAFTMIRKRGLGVADIAILVVAADDGIMPQTIEAINQAKNAGVDIVVAINKIDKVEPARVDVIKQMLSGYDLLTEDWGGKTIMVPISAKVGTNIDTLLELVALHAELMELKADKTVPAEGFILESQQQKGFGSTATFLAKHGMLRVGDFFAAGDSLGKVVTITDSHGNKLKEVGPAVPVKISGFESFPKSGDYLKVVSQDEYKHLKSEKDRNRVVVAPVGADAKLKLFIKADNESSREAIVEAIAKLSKAKKYDIAVVSSSVGELTENDIDTALAMHAVVYCFNAKIDQNASAFAKDNAVDVRSFNIIYKLLENIEVLAESLEEKKIKLVKTGEATVKKVFEIKKIGIVAGFGVKQGKMYKQGEVEIWRGNHKVGSGPIRSLQKDKKTVREVGVGFEGAMLVEGFDSWVEEDRIICFVDSTKI